MKIKKCELKIEAHRAK